jgi:dienelactone hydrolase
MRLLVGFALLAAEVHYVPPRDVPEVGSTGVLLVAGKEGWEGFARRVADSLASWGYGVWGIEPGADLGAAETRATRDTGRKLMLAGWAEGASAAILAAARPEARGRYPGLILIGARPSEEARAALARVAVPLVILHWENDVAEAKKMAAGAGEPKRLVLLQGRDRHFEGAQTLFKDALRDAVLWVGEQYDSIVT